MKYNLPRKYLSYSAYNLWITSKDGFRRRYYLNEKPFETVETIFGKKIGEMVENLEHLDHDIVSKIIDYPIKEHKIEVEYKGLKLLGYLDQFHDTELRVLEMKTGHKNKQGKVPWDKVKVQKHKQLVFYSTLVKLKYGKVHSEVILQWLETHFVDKTVKFKEHTLTAKSNQLELTGKIETFKRRIYEWERKNLLSEILQVADDISNDYTQWQKSQKK